MPGYLGLGLALLGIGLLIWLALRGRQSRSLPPGAARAVQGAGWAALLAGLGALAAAWWQRRQGKDPDTRPRPPRNLFR